MVWPVCAELELAVVAKILISSGDTQFADSTIRVTLHHNFFYNLGSRLPSIRFGKAHVFNNYYFNCGTAVNSRMGACVLVENNYFENTGTAVMMEYSPQKGSVQLRGNFFGNSKFSTEPSCQFNVPYDYEQFLDSASVIPSQWVKPTAVESSTKDLSEDFLGVYPNPFNNSANIVFVLKSNGIVQASLFNLLGEEVERLSEQYYTAGKYSFKLDATGFSSGIYLLKFSKGNDVRFMKVLLIK